MEVVKLIPTPDTIPAPWGVFEFLDVLTFILHILAVNIVVGGCLITLFARLFGKSGGPENTIHGSLAGKIPTLFAVSVTLGVAPLLFVQVLYGHLIYSSSVLMAVFWILVIPLLIIGYYGVYIHRINFTKASGLSLFALAVASAAVLYIAFMFSNNMTLMLSPEKWTAYFDNRSGTLLNLGDGTVYPRFFHFVTASIAVAGLFSAIVWKFRKKDNSAEKTAKGLRIFSFATMIQILVGCWLLLALPRDIMMLYMGGNMLYTALLTVGIIAGILAIVTSIRGKLWPTVIVLFGTVAVMAVIRALLRAAYLGDFFSVGDLVVAPQYDVLAVFLVIFIVGLALLWYMIKIALAAYARRTAQ